MITKNRIRVYFGLSHNCPCNFGFDFMFHCIIENQSIFYLYSQNKKKIGKLLNC